MTIYLVTSKFTVYSAEHLVEKVSYLIHGTTMGEIESQFPESLWTIQQFKAGTLMEVVTEAKKKGHIDK